MKNDTLPTLILSILHSTLHPKERQRRPHSCTRYHRSRALKTFGRCKPWIHIRVDKMS